MWLKCACMHGMAQMNRYQFLIILSHSGHLEWHVGRCSVVVRCLMEDCHHWVYQNCWRMVREWKHQTMLHALRKCTWFSRWIYHIIMKVICTCLQLPDCGVPVLAWQPWWEANILSVANIDQCCTLFNGRLPGVLRIWSMWWNRWGTHITMSCTKWQGAGKLACEAIKGVIGLTKLLFILWQVVQPQNIWWVGRFLTRKLTIKVDLVVAMCKP